jgi:type II secretory pathway pseudopilin PulG
MRHNRGFSLLEAVVTLGIVAAITIAMTQLMSGAGLRLKRLEVEHRQYRIAQQQLALALAGMPQGDQPPVTRTALGSNAQFLTEQICVRASTPSASGQCITLLRKQP